MKYQEEIHKYIQSNKNEIVEILKELIKIPSVRGTASENAPFGAECAKILQFIQNLYEKNGFETDLRQNSGYLLSYFGAGEKALGIFAHADVVPVSDDWLFTKPFEPIEKGGCIIGRGALDDKSAVVLSLYCAKILKELNIPFKSRLVAFTGVNEESGMQDVKNYLKENKAPDFSLVADTCFPLFRGNKGKIAFTVKSKEKLSGISVNGGTGATVIGNTVVLLPYSEDLLEDLYDQENISATKNGDYIKLVSKGIAKHSAIPDGAVSAVKIAAEKISKCDDIGEKDREIFKRLYEMSANFFGEFFNIEDETEGFGKLTCVLSKVETDDDGYVTAHFNIRYGNRHKKDEILGKIEEKIKSIGWEKPQMAGYSLPHLLPENNKFVEKLLKVFSEYTGRENAQSYVNAGGTYRQFLENAVETGTTLSWNRDFDLPQGHGAVHQPDEYINIEGLLSAIELTVLMLIEADKIV